MSKLGWTIVIVGITAAIHGVPAFGFATAACIWFIYQACQSS